MKKNTIKTTQTFLPSPCSMPVYKQHSVQATRLQFVLPDKREIALKVAAVWRWANCLLIGGWTSVPCAFQIYSGEKSFTPEFFSISASDNDEDIFFTLVLPIQDNFNAETLLLCVSAENISFQQAFPLQVDAPDSWKANVSIMMPALARIIGIPAMFSLEWHTVRALVAASSHFYASNEGY